ncbi:MAG: tRNA lysidine(34) synthetase TilS [Endomicrobium sp.]|nr:tRNA lysidine(34) synthetase TilS [Endomicrobium sp.]
MDRIILLVSGGIDSVCMLHLFWRLKKKININLLIVNFNHKLRKESTKESEIVKDLSYRFDLNCIFKNINVKKYSKKKSLSIETAGRNLRYLNTKAIAKKYKYTKIATAHNANDNAETVFMWILRGSGNFLGIPQVRQINKNITIIRPILPIKRELIEEYVSFHKLPFCIDQSNLSDKYTRNKIRLSIIPTCKRINSMVIEHIFSLSCIQIREKKYLEEISNKLLKKCVKIQKNQISLDLQTFLQYNEAVRFRILKNILPEKKYSVHIDFIMYKIVTSSVFVYELSKNWIFKINLKKAYFYKIERNEV